MAPFRNISWVALCLALCGWSLGWWPVSAGAESTPEVAGQHEVAGSGQAHDAGHAADAHGAEGHASASPVTLNPDLAIVTAIIFFLLLMVLGKFAWKPIIEAIDKREHGLAEQLADAKRCQEESQRLLAEHEKKLASTAQEVRQMLDQSRADAERQKQQILETAQAAAAAEKERAVREIHVAKNAVLQELAQKSVHTAVGLAGKIVQRQLSSDDHAQLIDDALGRFSSDN